MTEADGYKKFDFLCREAWEIREEVFVREQGFQKELDEIDERAVHLVFYDDCGGRHPVAVCRFYEEEGGVYHIGRIAVIKSCRGKHMGSRILRTAEELIVSQGGCKAVLAAQTRARGFYEKNGYAAVGEVFDDEGCEHIRMEKTLVPANMEKR